MVAAEEPRLSLHFRWPLTKPTWTRLKVVATRELDKAAFVHTRLSTIVVSICTGETFSISNPASLYSTITSICEWG